MPAIVREVGLGGAWTSRLFKHPHWNACAHAANTGPAFNAREGFAEIVCGPKE